MPRHFFVATALAVAVVSGFAQQPGATVTVDDLMKMRSIVDVQIAPDGGSVAYVVSTPNLDKNEHEAALFVVPAGGGTPARLGDTVRIFNTPSPRPQLRWSPDGRAVASSPGPRPGFSAAYGARLYVVALESGKARTVVDRAGMNTGPRFSPDGQSIAFISTGGKNDIMASRGLYVVGAAGGAPRAYAMDDAWVNEYVWSPDSKSIYTQANDGTFARGIHMFEQPVVRVSVADGRAERLGTGPTVAFALGISRDGRRIAF